MVRSRKPRREIHRAGHKVKVRLYTLEVFLLTGPISANFAKKNPVVSRTIQVRGDQTLEDLHGAIFRAYGRREEQMYEFQCGQRPMAPKGSRYVLPGIFESEGGGGQSPAGHVGETTIKSLRLKVGRRFFYWFDFVDDWWHQINVQAISDNVPSGTYPKVIRRVGKNPPQQCQEEDDQEPENGPEGMSRVEAADAACLVGELHLSRSEYEKAVEAFTRAIDNHPSADAYQGRAKAFRALAASDERRAEAEKTGEG